MLQLLESRTYSCSSRVRAVPLTACAASQPAADPVAAAMAVAHFRSPIAHVGQQSLPRRGEVRD